ncbi:MAG: PfkB family carbohydrate kinase [Phycisphaerales bacterium]|jgi:sugar/nucleoside kinase (ribokinase family)|nr:PfkB family carbohydrate kinase [Phycisphaerales bacterium]
MSLIVTGTLGIDTIETPQGGAKRVPGGSAAYFAAAGSIQTPVRLVGAVGDDWPVEHRSLLESFQGVDLAGLEQRAGSRTFAWGGKYLDNMNIRETTFTELGVLEEAPPNVPDSFRDSTFVFLANSHPSVQSAFLDQLPERQLTVMDTMDLWINIANEELHALLARIDGVMINDSEAELLTGITNPYSAGEKILDLGPGFVIIKKGEHGAVLVHRDGTAVIPAYPADDAQVVDPTGAGDSFAGGLMAYVARTGSHDFEALHAALAWGTVTASYTLESFGLDGLKGLTESRLMERVELLRAAARIG